MSITAPHKNSYSRVVHRFLIIGTQNLLFAATTYFDEPISNFIANTTKYIDINLGGVFSVPEPLYTYFAYVAQGDFSTQVSGDFSKTTDLQD